MQAIHIGLSNIHEEQSEKQDFDTSFVIKQKNTDIDRSVSDACDVCRFLYAHLRTFPVQAIEDDRYDPQSDALAEEPSEAEAPEVAWARSGTVFSGNKPQSEPSMAESRWCNSEDFLKEVTSNGVSKYSMLAVRGRHRASIALATGILADEEANLVWPAGFKRTPGDCGVGYAEEYRGATGPAVRGTRMKSIARTARNDGKMPAVSTIGWLRKTVDHGCYREAKDDKTSEGALLR